MISKVRKLFRHFLLFGLHSALGVAVTLLVVFVMIMNDRPDLSVWHTADLDEEFTVDSDVSTFEEYLELEDRLFRELDEEVYAKITIDDQSMINRFHKGSLSDPGIWPQNWNRSYEKPVEQPRAGVLLLHGMSDSPYSLRNLAERLNRAGAYVVGLRIPGHGTAPSGLTRVTWQDMAAAVKIAVEHLESKSEGQPLHILGYSNGGALAVNYALAAAYDAELPQISKVVLISPEIGISKAAVLAVWQARLGLWLGLDKLAWNSLLPEYDPYKYGSFAVNAGDVAHRLTGEIQRRITVLEQAGKLDRLVPILAFSSIVDATVSVTDLIQGLFNRLPPGGHELVLFNINSIAGIDPLLKWDPAGEFNALTEHPDRSFTLSLITNESPESPGVMLATIAPGTNRSTNQDLDFSWPEGVYSLTHVALPFPPDDPLYGGEMRGDSPGVHLGDIAFRGERGVLHIPPSEMLRLRWNPFYPFLEDKTISFLGLD